MTTVLREATNQISSTLSGEATSTHPAARAISTGRGIRGNVRRNRSAAAGVQTIPSNVNSTHNTNGRVNVSMHEFDAVLSRLEGKMPWTVLYVPFSVSDEFGTNGRLTVKVRFRSLAPYIQREEINRIEGAKTSQTRMKRISALVEKLS
ncbi:MAG: hypothetical protein BWY92_01334 [Firmicutes bacterium ADurb.BinA052]|nr:MAG: hypothetical protein BWY92_01334 [Firmicutes bacterium ADurb.BinA052]